MFRWKILQKVTEIDKLFVEIEINITTILIVQELIFTKNSRILKKNSQRTLQTYKIVWLKVSKFYI